MKKLAVILFVLSITFAISCGGGGSSGPAWHHPSSPDSAISLAGSTAGNVDAALNDSGDAVVVWRQLDGTNDCGNACYRLFISERRGGQWTHPQTIADGLGTPGEDVTWPQVDMNADGDAVITWHQRVAGGSTYTVYRMQYDTVAATWESPEQVNPISQNGQRPMVAMDNAGNVLIAYARVGTPGLFKTQYTASSETWDAPVKFDAGDTTNFASNLNLDMDDSGNAVIAWSQYENFDAPLYRSDFGFSTAGTWTHPLDMNDHTSPILTHTTFSSSIAMGGGEAYIAWRSNSSDLGRHHVFLSHFNGASWDDPTDGMDFVSIPSAQGGRSATDPAMAMDSTGDAILVWAQEDGTGSCNIYGCLQFFMVENRAGVWSTLSGPSDSFTPDDSDVNRADVAMDDNGNALVAWAQEDGSDIMRFFMGEYSTGSWALPQTNSNYFSPAGYPVGDGLWVGMADNGYKLILWNMEDASRDYRIMMSEYR